MGLFEATRAFRTYSAVGPVNSHVALVEDVTVVASGAWSGFASVTASPRGGTASSGRYCFFTAVVMLLGAG